MATSNVSESISREAPDIEERKIGLMDSAKAQIDAANRVALEGQFLNPDFQVASMSPDQLNALDLGRQGIGAYLPYMQNPLRLTIVLHAVTKSDREMLKVFRTTRRWNVDHAAPHPIGETALNCACPT